MNDDESLFNAAYREHHRPLYAYLFGRTGSREEAEDLLQEVFVRAWRHMETMRRIPVDRRVYWLLALARNLARDHYRRVSSRSRVETEIATEQAAVEVCRGDPTAALADREAAASVDRAIGGLPTAMRTALTLSLVGGLNSVEIGAMLGKSPATIRYQIAEARRRVAVALGLNTDMRDAEEVGTR